MKKFIIVENTKWMLVTLIFLSVISVFLEYRYTKERQLLDEVKFMYEKKMQDDLTLEENEFYVFVDTEKLITIFSNVDDSNTLSFQSKEDVVDVEMGIYHNEDFDTMKKILKEKGYTSYVSQGEGKENWDSLILTVK